MYSIIKNKISHYAESVEVNPPKLVAVSKTKSVKQIMDAYRQGARDFGENYIQEAIQKIAVCPKDCVWHAIGHVQSNKSRYVAENFDWIQTIDSMKIAERISRQRPPDMNNIQACIQVNIDNESEKSGCLPDELITLALKLSKLPGIDIRGLMVIPEQNNQAQSFAQAANLFQSMQKALPDNRVDTLSMGMSGDWQQAVQAGSTMVRIGTAIFGAR